MLESFALSFALIFLAEFADKTQLACISLVARYPKQEIEIFTGTISALFFVTLVGVIFGYFLRVTLPTTVIAIIAGMVFVMVGCFSLYSTGKKEEDKEMETSINNKDEGDYFTKSFALIALMEMGDKTQVVVISLAANFEDPLFVLIGAFFGFTLLTFIGVRFGKYITQKIEKERIEIGSAVIFIAIGILILISQLG